MNTAKSMVRLHKNEAEEDRTWIEMKGGKLEMSGYKKSVEKLLGG